MKRYVAQSMEAGALGLSSGLQYFPGLEADTRELIELAKVSHDFGGVFTCHLRSYSNTLDQAIDELVEICRKAEVRAQISHLFWVPHINPILDEGVRRLVRTAARLEKVLPVPLPMDTAVKQKLARLDKLIKGGLPLGIDAMPTSAGFTHLLAFLPPWALLGSKQAVLDRLKDPFMRRKIRKSIETGESRWPHREQDTWSMNFFKVMGWGCAFIMSVVSEKNQRYVGRTLKDIGAELGKHPFDVACDLLLEEDGRVLVFETVTWPNDDFVERSLWGSLTDPNVSIVTDTMLLGFGIPSHLFYDCYPKYLGKYVRDLKLISLQEAIRKCTSLPAKQLQLAGRGEIRQGYAADLVVFDPDTIRTNSTFERPDREPEGISHVIINGKPVYTPGGFAQGPCAGKLLRRGAFA